MKNEPTVESSLLLRVVADLQKELLRQKDEEVRTYIETQIKGLKVLYEEVEDYRTIKNILNK